MPRFFITAGHSRNDSGARANGLLESLLTIELRDLITEQCKALGISVVNDDDNLKLATVIKNINKVIIEEDTLLDIHFNSADEEKAKGVEAFVRKNATSDEEALARRLTHTVSQILGTSNRGMKQEHLSQHKSLGILHTKGRSVLLEVCFISNRNEIQTYLSRKGEIALQIAHELQIP